MKQKNTQTRFPRALLALLLSFACILSLPGLAIAPVYAAESAAETASFHYQHDPRLNPAAMADIVVDPTAIYGFAPRADGSLKQYAAYDWSDPEVVLGENGRPARIAYHESIQDMYAMLDEMTAQGKSVEEIARAVSAKRNEIRLAAYDNDPEGLATAKARNLERYGHEEGPLPDELYEQYGSWEVVIEKAFSVNSGMDACLGLYDDYYELYIAAGQIEAESVAAATREYAIAAFIQAAGFGETATSDALTRFADADEVSAYYIGEMAAAVENGIIRGYEDGTLRPQSTISRIEAFVILSRCLPELEAAEPATAFHDVPAWAEADVARLSAAGLIKGYGDGSLGSQDMLTVAQVSLLLDRLSGTGAAAPIDADSTLFAELVEANSFAEVVKRHSSKQLEATRYDENEEEIHSFTYYVDAGQFATENSAGGGEIATDLFYLWALTDEEGPYLAEAFFDREDAYQEKLTDAQEYTSLSIAPEETLIEVTELNGCWYMTTEVTDADWVRARIESDAETSGIEPVYTYADGMSYTYSYIFDKETKDLLEIWTYLREADGTEHSYGMDRVTYDVEYDLTDSVFAPYFEATEFRTIHFIFAPGTPEESTVTYTIPKDVYSMLFYQGEIIRRFYTDPDCTEVYQSGGERPDEITLYIPAQS